MIRLAQKLAAKSEHKQHHHACIITKGGKIIATGYNHKFMHAECDAIRRLITKWCRSRRNFKGLTLYSLRFRKGGSWGNAMPCENCMGLIHSNHEKYRIDTIYYTNEQGELTKL